MTAGRRPRGHLALAVAIGVSFAAGVIVGRSSSPAPVDDAPSGPVPYAAPRARAASRRDAPEAAPRAGDPNHAADDASTTASHADLTAELSRLRSTCPPLDERTLTASRLPKESRTNPNSTDLVRDAVGTIHLDGVPLCGEWLFGEGDTAWLLDVAASIDAQKSAMRAAIPYASAVGESRGAAKRRIEDAYREMLREIAATRMAACSGLHARLGDPRSADSLPEGSAQREWIRFLADRFWWRGLSDVCPDQLHYPEDVGLISGADLTELARIYVDTGRALSRLGPRRDDPAAQRETLRPFADQLAALVARRRAQTER